MSFKIKVGDFFRRNNRSNNEDELIAKKTRKNVFECCKCHNLQKLDRQSQLSQIELEFTFFHRVIFFVTFLRDFVIFSNSDVITHHHHPAFQGRFHREYS